MSDERRNASERVDINDEVLQWVTFKQAHLCMLWVL